MTTMQSKRSAIDRLSIPAVEAYLQRTGWTRIEGENPNARAYRGRNDIYGNPIVVVLPARPDLIDANLRLADVVRSLATLEAKSPQQLARKIVARQRTTLGKGRTSQKARLLRTKRHVESVKVSV
jgi:hypothetical protein